MKILKRTDKKDGVKAGEADWTDGGENHTVSNAGGEHIDERATLPIHLSILLGTSSHLLPSPSESPLTLLSCCSPIPPLPSPTLNP